MLAIKHLTEGLIFTATFCTSKTSIFLKSLNIWHLLYSDHLHQTLTIQNFIRNSAQ